MCHKCNALDIFHIAQDMFILQKQKGKRESPSSFSLWDFSLIQKWIPFLLNN